MSTAWYATHERPYKPARFSGLAEPEALLTRGFRDGNHAWVDIYPPGAPAMRVTHSIGGNMRVPPQFAGFGSLGATARPRKNVRCLMMTPYRMRCWNTETGEGVYHEPPGATELRAAAQSPSKSLQARNTFLKKKLDEATEKLREATKQLKELRPGLRKTRPPGSGQSGEGTQGLSDINCKRTSPNHVFCWDDTSGDPKRGGFFPHETLQGLSVFRMPSRRIWWRR